MCSHQTKEFISLLLMFDVCFQFVFGGCNVSCWMVSFPSLLVVSRRLYVIDPYTKKSKKE